MAGSTPRRLGTGEGGTRALLDAALAHHGAGDLARAEALYRQVLAADARNARAWMQLGRIALARGHVDAAIEMSGTAARLGRKVAEYQAAHAAALEAAGRFEEAIKVYRRALLHEPASALLHNNLGTLLESHARYDEAMVCYQRAMALAPRMLEAPVNMGNSLKAQGRLREAVAYYERGLAIDSGSARAHSNLGNALKALGELDPAIASYHRAIALDPREAGAHANLAYALLLAGRFEEGWREYEWRVPALGGRDYIGDPRSPGAIAPRPSTLMPLDFRGKRVLTVRDQGLGDEFFFLRFAQRLREAGAWHAYLPSARAAPLLARATGIDALVTEAAIPEGLDHVFLLGELPLLLGMTDAAQIPAPLALEVPETAPGAARARLGIPGGRPLLGVTWRAGTEKRPGEDGRLFKEITPGLLARALTAWPGEVVVLQRNPRPGEVQELGRALGRPVYDGSGLNDNLPDVLALLAGLEEYVGVSNTNMHLAAGVGRTARVLVPNPPEWRWMGSGDESPWFTGFRVYRQAPDGGWEGALTRLAMDLASHG